MQGMALFKAERAAGKVSETSPLVKSIQVNEKGTLFSFVVLLCFGIEC